MLFFCLHVNFRPIAMVKPQWPRTSPSMLRPRRSRHFPNLSIKKYHETHEIPMMWLYWLWNINNIFEWLCYDLLMLICWIFLLLSLFFIHYHCFYCIWLLIWWILHMGVWVDIDPMPGFRCTHYQSKRPVLRSRCPAFRLASDPGFWSRY